MNLRSAYFCPNIILIWKKVCFIQISFGPMKWRSPAKGLSSVKEVIPTLLPCYTQYKYSWSTSVYKTTTAYCNRSNEVGFLSISIQWSGYSSSSIWLVAAFVHLGSTFCPEKMFKYFYNVWYCEVLCEATSGPGWNIFNHGQQMLP